MKKFKLYILSILALIFFTYSSCHKFNNDGSCDFMGTYEFVMPFTLSPAKEVYKIGDTITISSYVENPIYDRKTDKEYYLEDFKFYLESSLYYMDTLINDYSNFNRFEILVDSSSYNIELFNYSTGSNSILGQYNYNSNNYSYEFKLIAKEKGSYLFIQGSLINYYSAEMHFEGKCENIENDARFYMNDRGNNNSYLLYEANNSNYKLYLNNLDEQYLDYGGYCFKVVE